MFTQTAKTILQPVAESIASLILLNLETEEHNLSLPDLSDAAAVVKNQADNLIKVGYSLANDSERMDESSKILMNQACEAVSYSAGELLKAAEVIKSDGTDPAGRRLLISSCQGLLDGTTRMLDVNDDCEVKRIVSLCDKSMELVNGLLAAKELNELVEYLKPSLQSFMELAALSNARIDEIIYSSLKNRLKNAVYMLDQAKEMMITATKANSVHLKNSDIIRSRQVSCEKASRAIEEIKAVVQIREWLEGGQDGQNSYKIFGEDSDIQKAISGIMRDIKKLDWNSLNMSYESYKFLIDILTDTSSSIADSCSGTLMGEALAKKIAEFEELRRKLDVMINAAINSSKLPEKPNTIYKSLIKFSDAGREIGKLSRQVVQSRFWELNHEHADRLDPESCLGKLYQSATSGNVEGTSAAIEVFRRDISQIYENLENAGLFAVDNEIQSNIKKYQMEITSNSEQIILAGKSLSNDPTDELILEHFNGAVTHWEKLIGRMKDYVGGSKQIFNKGGFVSRESEGLKKEYNEFIKNHGSKNKDASGKQNMASTYSSLKRLISDTQKQVENTNSDSIRKGLQSPMENLTKITTEIERKGLKSEQFSEKELEIQANEISIATEKIQKFYSKDYRNPHSPASISSFAEVEDNKKERWSRISTASSDRSDSRIIEVIGGNEVEIVDEPEPQVLGEKEAASNPIRAAAQALQVDVSHYSSYENPIVDYVKGMAEKMSEISTLYKYDSSDSKKNLMKNAQLISGDVSGISKMSREIAKKCVDNSLAKEVNSSLQRMETMATQLRILTSVKIAGSWDEDSERQLILCSQNLKKAVKSVLKSSEAANFRADPLDEPNSIKFRKVYFMRDSDYPLQTPSSPLVKSSFSPDLEQLAPVKSALLSKKFEN